MIPNCFARQLNISRICNGDEHWQEEHILNISIIIPCYNEAENIIDAVAMVTDGIDDSVSEYEIILVDDGSDDNSHDLICCLVETKRETRAIFHPRNVGKGAALRSGFTQARMDWILTMDADLQIDISGLKAFLPFCAEYDIITGYRTGRNEGLVRSVVSKVYNFVTSAVIGSIITPDRCGISSVLRQP